MILLGLGRNGKLRPGSTALCRIEDVAVRL